MNAIVTTISSIILMIALGYFLKRIDFLSQNDLTPLNKIVVNIFLPCMIFSALYSADLTLLPKLWILPFVILISSFLTGIVSLILLKKFKYDDKKMWSVLVTVMIANTGFMGYPVTLGVFGHAGFLRAIFCDIATMVIFTLLSFVLVLKFGGSYKKAFKKIFLFPAIWAIILGLLFNLGHIPIGNVLNTSINYLSQGTIPLIMLFLGLSIDFSGFSRSRFMIMFTSVMKLLIFPLFAFLIVNILCLDGLEHTVSIVEASMPSGMLSLVLAISYGLDFELTSDCILISTVISLITLPIVMMIV